MLDTKGTLIAAAIILFIIYFAYSTTLSQAEEIKVLKRTLDTLRSFIPRAKATHETMSTGSPARGALQTRQPPGPPPGPAPSISGRGFVPRNIKVPDAIGQRPARNSPFPPAGAAGFGIGAGLDDSEPDPTRPLSDFEPPPLPTYT